MTAPDVPIRLPSSQALHLAVPEWTTCMVTSNTVDEVIRPTQWHVNPDLVSSLSQNGDEV